MQRILEEQKRDEEKAAIKEKELMKKDVLREKIREQTKDWYYQQSVFISELNSLKKNDQHYNYLKNQESKKQLKEKVLNKHRKHDQIVERIKETQQKFNKIKANMEAEIFLKKQQNYQNYKDPYQNFEKKNSKNKQVNEDKIELILESENN